MTEKIVTHEDLSALRDVKTVLDAGRHLAESRAADALVNRLIAAAEADQPPLPEGWVLLNTPSGRRALWHQGGVLYHLDMPGSSRWATVGGPTAPRDRLTPLRPTVTEADVERAARAARATYYGGVDDWDEVYQATRDDWMKTTRAALDALDIEVRS